MIFIAIFLFWLSVAGIVFSYLIYPLILGWLSSGKILQHQKFTPDDTWPRVFVLMAVYNEEKVIAEKIESIIKSHYPFGKIYFYIGSDLSTDRTDEIVQQYAAKHDFIRFSRMKQRTGKSGILNVLHQKILEEHQLKYNDVYVLTDANVIFEELTIYELARHYKDPKMGVVAANVKNRNVQSKGISKEEETYIQRENRIKYMEGVAFGATIGAFGACYALRAKLFETIPPRFLMEDFYLSMLALEKGYCAITDLNAVVVEDVSVSIFEEFKRKKRISAGNYQNLSRFKALLSGKQKGVAFAFFSHKVLRWISPFLIVFSLIISGLLGTVSPFYSYIFWIQLVFIGITIIDLLLQFVNIKLPGIRYISYFHLMNLALMVGFFKYLKGIKTNVWQPTTRNT